MVAHFTQIKNNPPTKVKKKINKFFCALLSSTQKEHVLKIKLLLIIFYFLEDKNYILTSNEIYELLIIIINELLSV